MEEFAIVESRDQSVTLTAPDASGDRGTPGAPAVSCDSKGGVRGRCLLVALLCLLSVVCYGHGLTDSGFDWPDEAIHAMDGVLIYDWVSAGPSAWAHPMAFARQQYARYPALGMGLHYPPGFAVVESGVYAVLGVSSVSARVTVLLFAVLTVAGAFLLMDRTLGRPASVTGAVCLLAMPLVVHWSRQTMLEMPTLAAMVWSAVLFFRYLDRPTWGRALVFALVTASIPFFKQPGIFLLPLLFVWALLAAVRRKVSGWHVLLATLIIAVLVGPFFLATLMQQGHVVELVGAQRPWWDWFGLKSWATVVPWLFRGAGAAISVAAAIGLVVGLFRRDRVWVLAVAWLAAGLVFNVLVQHKEARFLVPTLLPVALLVGVTAEALFRVLPVPAARLTAAAVVVVAAVVGFAYAKPEWRDSTHLVCSWRQHFEGDVALYVGKREPDFIFAVRQTLGPQGPVILRGSKLFYTCASDPRYHYEGLVRDVNSVEEILEAYAPAAIFVEDKVPFDLEEEKLVRQCLAASRHYQRVATVETITRPHGGTNPVHVYLRTTPGERTATELTLPIPLMGETITMPLSTLGVPQGPRPAQVDMKE